MQEKGRRTQQGRRPMCTHSTAATEHSTPLSPFFPTLFARLAPPPAIPRRPLPTQKASQPANTLGAPLQARRTAINSPPARPRRRAARGTLTARRSGRRACTAGAGGSVASAASWRSCQTCQACWRRGRPLRQRRPPRLSWTIILESMHCRLSGACWHVRTLVSVTALPK